MIVYDEIIPAERAVPGGLGGNFQNDFFPLLSEWVPDEPCLSSFRLEAAEELPAQAQTSLVPPGRSTQHQMLSIQILIPLLQSTAACFCLPKGSQLESSTQKKPEKLRHEKHHEHRKGGQKRPGKRRAQTNQAKRKARRRRNQAATATTVAATHSHSKRRQKKHPADVDTHEQLQ